MLGQTLLTRYKIESELGRGSMGVVYRARDTLLDRDVAVKVLSQSNLGTESRLHLLAEARAVAKLEHPHIMTVYDAGEVDGVPFIVLQLVQGKSLLEWGALSFSQVLLIGKQLSDALAHAHRQGIIHRDVKPENVIVSGDDENLYARLMDFGLAYANGQHLTQGENHVGTAAYMAPEIILGQPASPQSDLYSLGVTLFEIATGHLPFEGDNLMAVLGGHLHSPVPSISAFKADIPPEFENLICRLLDKQPAWRPASAQEVYSALERLEPLKARIPFRTRNSNLPAQLTSFVGREKEIAEIKQALDERRLVTLTGSGGTGKTRLSLQVGEGMIEEFEHGVWFIELASISDEQLVAQIVASALRVPEETGGSIIEALVKYVKDKELLIILDNCEHLAQASAKLVKQLTQSCPHLSVLASSREPLHVAGEATYSVPSLSIPDPKKKITIETLKQFDAVRLFIDRAVTAQPTFQLTNQNAHAVAEICHNLDGIPLALELAAVRVRSLSVEKIAERLSQRFSLLTSGDKTVSPRQQTLRALIDWSHDMLSEPERAGLRRLSVFAGGWTLEAAESVIAGTYVDKMYVLDLLSNLVEKSLVTCNCTSEIPRYFMLETLRQYAGEKLDSSAETDLYRQIHAEYFLKLAEEAEPQLTGTEQAIWFNHLQTEHDNLRTAIEWAIGAAKTEMAQRLCGSLGRFWWVHGHMTEGRIWLKQALAIREGVSKEVQAKALRWAGGLAWPQGDLLAAKIAFDESISLYRELGDMAGMANVLGNLGTVAQNQGDYASAWEMFSQSLEFLRVLGNKWGMANALNNLGNVAQEQGDYAKAQTLQEESLAFRRELGDSRGMGIALNNLGSIALEQNKVESARAYFEQSLKINYEISARMMLAYNLSGMAQVLGGEGQAISAAQLQGATKKLLEEMGAPLEPYEQSLYEKTAIALKQALGEKYYQQAFEAGEAMSLEQTINLALRKEERSKAE